MHMMIGLGAAVMSAVAWGMVWYSLSVFGATWFRLTFPGKDYDDIKKDNMGLIFLAATVAQGVIMIIMHYVLGY